ncbi:hypothetical protein ACOMICROBIO_GDFFDHBD_02815 [Vibrio sp. B1REV9]|uniref:oxidoreductase n=1 Tax=Vibrio sp. B1REV9 TaxID=2751179 RepID=UPI001AF0C591|nr:oxidoreductase [Vibrio sp. B1REV9]CAE6934424.1 hypothetical protein ACOMICROBIO_GDFFDHBD_02815 [Vibrio sp. B1REV9]
MKKTILTLTLCTPMVYANTLQFSQPESSDVILSLSDLEAFPATTYHTSLPWLERPEKFMGVKLSTLLVNAYGEVPNTVELRALNDYHAYLSKQDILKYQPIVAYKQNDHYIKIRHKGPYWLIYPLAEYPEINISHYHSQMVWQLSRIKITRIKIEEDP